MVKVIIFGLEDFAELAYYYLKNDSDFEVVAFSVNKMYLPKENNKEGLPIVAFENIEEKYPTSEFCFFAPMAPKNMNKLREKVYHSIKEKGYQLISYISSKATLFDNEIGDNCFILENNTIQPFTKIGNNVVLWSGNHIGHHSEIEDHVTFTSHVVMSGHCRIKKYSVLGVNSTIRDGITINEGTFVGMSASVTKSTEEWSMYLGVPAKKIKSLE
jgi:sugar O-acyltransferase (sialic acid O-acetyltransferase NeuD family)